MHNTPCVCVRACVRAQHMHYLVAILISAGTLNTCNRKWNMGALLSDEHNLYLPVILSTKLSLKIQNKTINLTLK
jgi:hypothetical protein